MNPDTNRLNDLFLCLASQNKSLERFIAVLEKENAVLRDAPSEADLETLSHEKMLFSRELAEQDQQRKNLLRSLGLEDTRDAIEGLGQHDARLIPIFTRLLQNADTAQTLNRRNGAILQSLLEHNEKTVRALHALTGDDLYDARGKLTGKRQRTPDRKA